MNLKDTVAGLWQIAFPPAVTHSLRVSAATEWDDKERRRDEEMQIVGHCLAAN